MTNSLSQTKDLLVDTIRLMQRQTERLEALEARLEVLQSTNDESTKEA